jgi:hypothetical protein
VVESAITFLRRKYQIDACYACLDTRYATLKGIEELKSIKQEGVLLEKKNMLGSAVSLSGYIIGGMRI